MPFGRVCFIDLILVPLNGDDESKTLPYANRSNCPMGADAGQLVIATVAVMFEVTIDKLMRLFE